MTGFLRPLAVGTALLALAPAAEAAGCDPGKPGEALTLAEAQAVYDCLRDDLHAGYMRGDKRWIPAEFVADYRSWTPVSRLPGNPGFHGGRFLFTWVSPPGDAEYLKYKDEDVQIPAGTVIAKESFQVTEAGKAVKGPLFLMQKVAAGASPETMDWHYMAVAPDGAPMAVEVMSACNDCHVGNFGDQGGLGYPVPEARVGQ